MGGVGTSFLLRLLVGSVFFFSFFYVEKLQSCIIFSLINIQVNSKKLTQ